MIRIPWGNADYLLAVMSPTLSNAGGNETIMRQIEQQGTYESERALIKISNLTEADTEYDGPTISLSRVKIKKLNEVSVTASKVMFYHKGDTLMYNADAFVFSEGSSLDAIIEQLPGVELRKNGRIYVNGKFVETLLLNGKDLFNGNNQLMLENLPAYTVKDIAVYNHAGRSSKLMGYNTGDTKYVMDVRLKRQYRTGGMLNLEGGYGTSDRYIGKLFGMLFSDNVSFSIYGGANNLSDAAKPGQSDGAWNSSMMGQGMNTRQMGGMSYVAQRYNDKWEAKGSIDVSNTLTTIRESTTTQTYLSQGDNFYYGRNNEDKKKLTINTSHYFAFDIGNRISISFSPEFQYNRDYNHGNIVSAVFKKDYSESINPSIINSIFDSDSAVQSELLNRYMRETKHNTNYFYGRLNGTCDIRTKSIGLKNMLSLNIDVDYSNSHDNQFNKLEVDYSKSLRTFANQYLKGHPSFNWDYGAALKFRQMISEVRYGDYLQIEYKYQRNDKTRTSELFLLNRISDYTDSEYPIGYLPPISIYKSSIDSGQSYLSETKENFHTLRLSLYSCIGATKNWNYSINYSCDLVLSDRFIWYNSEERYFAHRTKLLPSFYLGNSVYKHFLSEGTTRKTKETRWDLDLTGKSIGIPLINIIDYVNTVNPMYTIMGNPTLQDSYKLDGSLKFTHINYPLNQTHNARISYQRLINDVTRGIYYDTATGQQTERPYNVNGNWDLIGSYSFSTHLGRNRRFELSTTTTSSYTHRVDLFESTDHIDLLQRPLTRAINTLQCKEALMFTWKLGAHRLTLNSSVEMRDYRSPTISFTNFKSWESKFGSSAILNFRYNWELSTDISLYLRRGYLDPVLNTSDIIWNLRVSKSIIKGKLYIAIDGFDLLHQLSNITYNVNAQARSEVVINTIPNYFLLHLRRNFNKSAKEH